VTDAPPRIKRFYKDVTYAPAGDRFAVRLDGRTAKTQGGHPLSAPNEALAEAVADEWRAQGEHIERVTMPLTAILSAAIDGGDDLAAECREEVTAYLGSDLICYRADGPYELSKRQAAAWNPYVEFLRGDFGAPLVVTSGIMSVTQPAAALSAVRRSLDKQDVETMFALRLATAITGSAAMALALWRQVFPPEQIFDASLVDEYFQEARWGADDEALARRKLMRAEFLAIGDFLNLLSQDGP